MCICILINKNTNTQVCPVFVNLKDQVMKNIFKMIFLAGMVSSMATYAQNIQHEIRFPAKMNSAEIKGAVVRGDQDIYVFNAGAKQTMSVKIISEENNAVFNIKFPGGVAPKNAAEGDDATQWSGKLPASGRYKIFVGGTRGNASYKLIIQIK